MLTKRVSAFFGLLLLLVSGVAAADRTAAGVPSQAGLVVQFGEGQVEWVMDTGELLPGDTPPEQAYEYTVNIKMGDVERKVIVYINYPAYPSKAVPVPPR